MALYDGLPLDTPTKIDAASVAGDVDCWATRTANGGTVEFRPVANGPSDLMRQREVRIAIAIATLRTWASDARSTTVTTGNNNAVTQTVVTRLGTFFDNFADLLQSLGKG